MALSFPYPLAFFCDLLRVNRVRLRLQRNDEQSGSGDGRFWSAELARPLWTAEASLATRPETEARELEAKIDGLDGMHGTFLFSDPAYKGPASGVTSGLGAVTILGISADRGGISLSGLPAGYVVTAGDFLSIVHGTYVYFGRFAEGGTAGVGGNLAVRAIRPFLPLTVQTGAAVELVLPYFKAIIPPGGYAPFNYDLPSGEIAVGGSLTVLQRP